VRIPHDPDCCGGFIEEIHRPVGLIVKIVREPPNYNSRYDVQKDDGNVIYNCPEDSLELLNEAPTVALRLPEALDDEINRWNEITYQINLAVIEAFRAKSDQDTVRMLNSYYQLQGLETLIE
jgi:hypothetical protein